MNNIEKNITEILKSLKDEHQAIGIKAEFEDEGSSLEEILRLNNLAEKVGLDLTVKIGGCGALNDINQTKIIGAKTVVAPMIESAYALKKFVQTANFVYSEETSNQKPDKMPQLIVNIETITGSRDFEEIFSIEEAEQISGVVVGRFDLAKSLGLQCKDCNGERIFNIVDDLAIKTQKLNKTFAVGGGITDKSIDFFLDLDAPIDKFETRKIIFDAKCIHDKNAPLGILKAIDFEIAWIKLRNELYGIHQDKDLTRIAKLEARSCNFSAGSAI